MFRKRVVMLIIYMLVCCTVVSSCGFINSEKTEQSGIRKKKRKSKRKKKKRRKRAEKETKDGEKETKTIEKKVEKPDKSSERERLKTKLAEALDDFLTSNYTDIVVITEGTDEDYSLIESKLNNGNNTIYFLSMEYYDDENPINILTDGEATYVTNDDNTDWERYDYYPDYVDAPMAGVCYISYISFIYAALDANLDYEHYPKEDVYYIEADGDAVAKLDFKAINSKVNNAAKLAGYDKLLLESEESIKMYYPDNDVVKTDYIFSVEDNAFVIFETLYDIRDEVIEHSSMVRLKEQEDDIEDKNELIELFDELRSRNFEDKQDNEDFIPDFQLLKN